MKIRRIELRHEEFLAGISGELTPAELGVYWMICLLQYSRNGQSLRYDMDWLRAKFRPTKANRCVEDIVTKLISIGKVYRQGDEIGVRRVREEAEKGLRRIREAAENGRRGGRPLNEINGLDKGYGSGDEKLNSSTDSTDSTESSIEDSMPATTTPREARRVRRKEKVLLDDWQPSEEHRRIAAEEVGRDACWTNRQAELYRDQQRNAKGSRKHTDFDAGFRKWIRSSPEFERGLGLSQPTARRPSSGSIIEAVNLAMSVGDLGDPQH